MTRPIKNIADLQTKPPLAPMVNLFSDDRRPGHVIGTFTSARVAGDGARGRDGAAVGLNHTFQVLAPRGDRI